MIDQYTQMIQNIKMELAGRDDIQDVAVERALKYFDIDVENDDEVDGLVKTDAFKMALDREVQNIFRHILE